VQWSTLAGCWCCLTDLYWLQCRALHAAAKLPLNGRHSSAPLLVACLHHTPLQCIPSCGLSSSHPPAGHRLPLQLWPAHWRQWQPPCSILLALQAPAACQAIAQMKQPSQPGNWHASACVQRCVTCSSRNSIDNMPQCLKGWLLNTHSIAQHTHLVVLSRVPYSYVVSPITDVYVALASVVQRLLHQSIGHQRSGCFEKEKNTKAASVCECLDSTLFSFFFCSSFGCRLNWLQLLA